MILEGIITTVDAQGVLNVAPMGPRIDSGMDRFILQPFQTATTFQNLCETRAGVLHVTDDALMLARAAIGHELDPPRHMATHINGWILTGACRAYEFEVADVDTSEPRARIEVATVAHHDMRPFFGWNRAMHAVLEAAILATRTHLLPPREIRADLARLNPLVVKTGGPNERDAFDLLLRHIESNLAQRDDD